MKSDANYVLKSPVVTEEATIQKIHNKYVFRVDPRANKNQIRQAVEEKFKVTVTSVNTMNYLGKESARRGRWTPGRRPNWKKAVVTLRDGDSIDLL